MQTIDRSTRKVIAVVCAVIAAWVYLAAVTFPLRRERVTLGEKLIEAERKVSVATRELEVLGERKAKAGAEASLFAWASQLRKSMRRPHVVEVPGQFVDSFRAHGLDKAEVQLTQMLPFGALPEHAIAKWEVRLAHARVLPFGEAFASLENALPLGHLKALAIQRKDPSGVAEITFEMETLVQP